MRIFTCYSFFTFLFLVISCSLSFAQSTLVQTCDLSPYASNDHAVWLNQLPGDPSQDYIFGPDGGTLNLFDDSTAQVIGEIVHESDTSRRWLAEFWLINQRDYTEWTNLGRGLKNGGGASQLEQEGWLFWELDSTRSRLIGTGSVYAGDTLFLFHNPADFEFGFQLGIGANDKDGDFGISGWFKFDGSYSGRGDINADVSCDTVPPPPPPICEISIDTFYANCKTDSTFEMVVAFSGVGDEFIITDDQGTAPLGNLSPGTHIYGEYLNSIDVQLTIQDTSFVDCIDFTPPVTADCTPVPICDLSLDSVSTVCLSDSTFGLVVSFGGSSQLYEISDDLGTDPLDSLVAGTYNYGEYPADTTVTLFVFDRALFSCIEFAGPFAGDSCATDTTAALRVSSSPVFPNPVRNQASIKLDVEDPGQRLECLLVDGMGRVRERDFVPLTQGEQEVQFDWTAYQPGLYFLRLLVGGELVSAQRVLLTE
ncbi:MAG: hypothetical protein AAF399_04600 [Bacteroidota bacterium]